MWNWNVQQLFVFVSAEWDTESGSNRVIVWDRVIQQEKDAHLQQVMVLTQKMLNSDDPDKLEQLLYRMNR